MATATDFSADTPAYIQFSQMESWLASSSALQLPLYQIESQQQAKGREVQRLLLQAHLQHRGNGDVGPALQLQQADGAVLFLDGGIRSGVSSTGWSSLPDAANSQELSSGSGGSPRRASSLDSPAQSFNGVAAPIPIPEALAIARQIAEALEYAQEKGIVHRDLKPANVKFRPDGAFK